MRCHFIPPYLLQHIAASDVDADVCRCGHATMAVDESLRSRRDTPPPVVAGAVAPQLVHVAGQDAWTVFTAANGSELPGEPVRSAGEPASDDPAVDEAYAGVEASLAMFRDVLARESYDGKGAPVTVTVHYERNYDNAFWDGRQLVFGDGDGRVFDRFTKAVDVLAHEFTHAVTQHTAGLTYSGQPGALNESVSDVFASCVKQQLLGQSATEADWLIGEGIFMPSVQAKALRSMAAPGTAYDDPVLGRDPQVASMADYVQTSDDNGGVHINSGIPNRAFYLCATALGGSSSEVAGPIWYSALTSGIGPDTDFAGFAAATVASAGAVSDAAAEAVAAAWKQVGVSVAEDGDDVVSVGAGGTGRSSDVVAVRRTGGFAGLERAGEVCLGDDPRTPEVEQIINRIDLQMDRQVDSTEGVPSPAQPDRFLYSFTVQGREVTLAEHELTPELSRLAAILLDE